jgi:Uma2 family endonuclease
MTPIASPTPIIDLYPSGDGQPVAETFDHLYAILMMIELLRLYLHGQQATFLGNQYLYYSQGYPKLRIAPDVMVIFDVAPGGRDNYKIWEEGAIPRVAFDVLTPLNIKITSPSTRNQDEGFKKDLYEQMGIQEYWQFDPKAQYRAAAEAQLEQETSTRAIAEAKLAQYEFRFGKLTDS